MPAFTPLFAAAGMHCNGQQVQLSCVCVLGALQAQQRRILQLEGEVEALRVEAGRQQESLTQQRAQTRAAESRIQELQQELDNNAGA